eukprot:gnl/MRDRNA2_/MRDRNA2_129472_c0_seq1.p1 gnl/MRDRNA2_/MRDRNA2_129472_c0~~gnl/MRDRNA2_/MRDRNA2_129472_c0_seq1.p1  ORF type:complete len:290 (+),score=31.34 gnl/MRDRNA2_/MRDRNA2_129472_c0_seq1:134-1003(+)
MGDDEDDPMVFLAKKREQMAAMAEMVKVAEMQAQLASDVKDRMARISRLLEEPVESPPLQSSGLMDPGCRGSHDRVSSSSNRQNMTGDQEVNYWRQKIALLSGPAQAHPNSLPGISAPAPQHLCRRGVRGIHQGYSDMRSHPQVGSMPQHLIGSTRQGLNSSTPKRPNISTPQRINASTPQRLNASNSLPELSTARQRGVQGIHQQYRDGHGQRPSSLASSQNVFSVERKTRGSRYFLPAPAPGSNRQSGPIGPSAGLTSEQEVEFWNRRIEELSVPTQILCQMNSRPR